jgi:glucokinase
MAAKSLGSEDLTYIGQAAAANDGGINIIGPKAGYSAQVGTLVSMLTWMQVAIGGRRRG